MIYVANEDGVIFNENGKAIKQQVRKDGYKTFTKYSKSDECLCRCEYYSHRFIWESLIGVIPEGMQIDHINGDKGDNRLSNLRLLTPKANSQLRESNKLSMSMCRVIRDTYASGYYSQRELAEDYDVSKTTIYNCINHKTWN